jgi:hypothetical protein
MPVLPRRKFTATQSLTLYGEITARSVLAIFVRQLGLHSLLLAMAFCGVVSAQVSPSQEYSNLIRSQSTGSPLGPGLLGESIDYYTGQTDFVTKDVSLPGNNGLPVALGRRYHVANRAGGPIQGAFENATVK